MSHYALFVGINDYPGRGSDLRGCLNDIKGLRKMFDERGLAASEHAEMTLLNDAATEMRVKDVLTSSAGSAVAGDTIIFCHSSHGAHLPCTNEPDGMMGTLVTYDFDWTSRQGITDDWLRAWMATIRPGVRVLIWLDTCFSGEMDRAFEAQRRGDTEKTPKFLQMPESVQLAFAAALAKVGAAAVGAIKDGVVAAVESFMNRVGLKREFAKPKPEDPEIMADIVMIAACQPGQTSSECRMGMFNYGGAFTQRALYVLDWMKTAPTWSEWMEATRRELEKDGFEQVPLIYSLGPKGEALLDERIPEKI